nr:hypothetical protein [Acinetobacter indicus]
MDQILAEFEQQTAPTAEDYVTMLRRLLAVSPECPHPGRGKPCCAGNYWPKSQPPI